MYVVIMHAYVVPLVRPLVDSRFGLEELGGSNLVMHNFFQN